MFTAVVNIVFPVVTDNCGGGQISAVRSDNLPLNDPYPLGQTTITWTATDACGNVAVVTQIITIADTQAPMINYCPAISPQCFHENSNYIIPVLNASDNWGIQSISYVITGVTSREGRTNDASGIFNPGISIIHWTVTDLAGNSSNCSTEVAIDKVDASLPDAYATNITPAIGSPNTIYIGYGGSSITLTAIATSSVNPNSFSYKWTIGSPGGIIIGTGPTITVSPSMNTTYFVSIKDVNNCKPQSQIAKLINVVDIHCGDGKIWICEKQKNGTFKSVCVLDSKVDDMPVGSYLGQCPVAITKSLNMDERSELKNGFNILVTPNPSIDFFQLRVQTSNTQDPIRIKVVDMAGRIVYKKQHAAGEQLVRLGKEYGPGIYIIEAIQGVQKALVKVVKFRN
jgi:hypothetical protein